jgi:hypothetical protein
MSKRSIQIQETLYCGIDVSAKSLTMADSARGSACKKRVSLTIRMGTGILSSGYGKPSHRFEFVGSNGNLLSRSRVCA